jgi:hypothetical protein
MPPRNRRLSPQAIDVLTALAGDPGGWLYGLEVCAATSLKSGSLYPILARLAERGLLENRWLEPQQPGRPARHAYRITRAGKAALRQTAAPSMIAVRQGAR